MTTQLVMSQAEIDTHREGWLAQRRTGITGTEVAQLLGISHYGSAFSLYHAKLDGLETEDKPALARGRHLEPVVEDMLCAGRPWYALRPAGLYRAAAQPWRMATLDRWVLDTHAAAPLSADLDGFLDPFLPGADLTGAVPGEIKTWATRNGAESARWGDPGTPDVPVGIRAQALWNMDVAGADEILIVVLFMDTWRVEVYPLRRDDEAAQSDLDLMIREAERFLHRVAERDEPEPDDHPATTDTLRRLHPSLTDESVRIPAALWRRYTAARAAEAAAKARVRGAQNDLRYRMGSAARAHVLVDPDGAPLPWRVTEGREAKVCSRSIGDHPVRAFTRHDDKLTPGRERPPPRKEPT